MPDCLGLTSPKVSRDPVDEVRMKVGSTNVAKKKVMLDGVESFADVDGDGGRTHGRLPLIEANSDAVGEREKGS